MELHRTNGRWSAVLSMVSNCTGQQNPRAQHVRTWSRLGNGSDCISLYAVAALARRVERIAARVVFVALYRRSTAMEWQIDLSNSS
jgi:hypothetical protein